MRKIALMMLIVTAIVAVSTKKAVAKYEPIPDTNKVRDSGRKNGFIDSTKVAINTAMLNALKNDTGDVYGQKIMDYVREHAKYGNHNIKNLTVSIPVVAKPDSDLVTTPKDTSSTYEFADIQVDTTEPEHVEHKTAADGMNMENISKFINQIQFSGSKNVSRSLLFVPSDNEWSETVVSDMDGFNTFLVNDTVVVDLKIKLPDGTDKYYEGLTQKSIVRLARLKKGTEFQWRSKEATVVIIDKWSHKYVRKNKTIIF